MSTTLLGACVDLAIALTLLEGLALFAWRRGLARRLLPTWLAGLALMLALRAAVADAGAASVVAALTAAGAAHGLDLVLRSPAARRRRRGDG